MKVISSPLFVYEVYKVSGLYTVCRSDNEIDHPTVIGYFHSYSGAVLKADNCNEEYIAWCFR